MREILRGQQRLRRAEEPKTSLSTLEAIGVLGVVLLIVGSIFAVFGYLYYTGGRPEGLINTEVGTFHQPEIEAEHPHHAYVARGGLFVACLGLILSGTVLSVRMAMRFGQRKGETG